MGIFGKSKEKKLREACDIGDASAARELIRAGANINAGDEVRLLRAGRPRRVAGAGARCGVAGGARKGWMGAGHAARQGRRRRAGLARVRRPPTLCLAPRRSQLGRTPLHEAARCGKVECMKVLMEAGANKEAERQGAS